MSNKITIIDYGLGNLFSVRRAFEICGAEVHVTESIEEIINADRLVLPGVGAFEDGMKGLEDRGLIEPILNFSKTGKPFMGICLGMQMMMDYSEEFGHHRGLGLIKGKVEAIPKTDQYGNPHKIPNIGWSELVVPESMVWNETILENIGEESSVYFVHSYTVVPEFHYNRLADSFYNGRVISAAIKEGNLYGCQFHPEKSSKVGLKILSNFMKLR